jgi:GntR family transcriptional repressor for pyruvate dehydrogenase complex
LAQLAAEKATDEDIIEMEATIARANKSLDSPTKILYAGLDFHRSICKASGNRLLTAVMNSIDNLLIESREKTNRLVDNMQESVEQHAEILNAIKKNDIEGAANKMLDHLNKARDLLRQL